MGQHAGPFPSPGAGHILEAVLHGSQLLNAVVEAALVSVYLNISNVDTAKISPTGDHWRSEQQKQQTAYRMKPQEKGTHFFL